MADPHEFTEDVADGSMCICGVPALTHHLIEPAASEPPAGPEAAPRPGPAGLADRGWVECVECGAVAPAAFLDDHACPRRHLPDRLYVRHAFDDTRPDVLGPPDGTCTVLDDDGQLCGRRYGEHLT